MARRQMDIKKEVKDAIVEIINEGINLHSEDVFQTDGYTFAIPVYTTDEKGNEIEVFGEVKITCKNWYATAKSPAYDALAKENDYKFTISEREKKAKEIADKKAKKIAKQNKAKGE